MPLRLYIETSVFGALFDQETERVRESKRVLEAVSRGAVHGYVSPVLFEEIARAPDDLKSLLEEEIAQASPEVLAMNKEIEALAREYVASGAVTVKFIDDARHIAVASYWSLDAVVSWNFRHMVNIEKKHLYQSVNLREGHRLIDIVSPPEVPYV